MSDEELVQCPINPNHQVPRSQIDEHVKTCKFLIDPNQETQNTFSFYGEPRPSTSYQEASQERSPQQEGSQMATLPIPESTSFQEWRSPKKTEIQGTSPSKLKRQKPYPKPLKSREISAKSVRASSKTDLSSDKKSKKGLLAMRKETYLKELSRKQKDLKKLKIDSSSDDNSSSSTDSALSLEDTMSDNKKIILYEMSLEFKSQIPSTSQQTDSSQQAVILQPPKLTFGKKDEKMDDESSVDPSSRFLPEQSDQLEFEIGEPSLPEDVPQEHLESVSSYAETSDDSIDLQRLSRKRKMENEKMDTEEIVEVKVSHLLAQVTTPLEVELEELSSSKEIPLRQSQPFSFHAALSCHSEVSDQLKMICKKKREEMDTEENIVAEASHTLTEVTTQLEVEMQEPSLAADVPQQQLQSVSFHAASTSDSDYIVTTNDESQQADISQQESSFLQEDNSLHEVSSLQEDSLPQGGSLLQADNSLYEVSSLQEDSLPQGSSLLQEDNSLHEVSSLQEDSLPQKGSLQQEDNSLHGVSSLQEDSLPQKGSLLQEDNSLLEDSLPQKGSLLQADNSLYEVSSLQEDSLPQGSSLLQEDNSLHEVSSLQEDSLSQKGSLQQEDNTLHEISSLQEDSLPQKCSLLQEDNTLHEVSSLQEDSLPQKRSLLQADNTLHEVSSLQEDSLPQKGSLLQEDNSLHGVSSLQEDSLPQKGSLLQEDNSLHGVSSLQEDSLPQKGNLLQEDNSLHGVSSLQEDSLPQKGSLLQEDNSLQEDSLSQGGSLLQKDSSQPEESCGEETSDMLDYLHSIETGSSESTTSFQEEQIELDVSHDKAKHELNVPQEERRLRKRLHESSTESTDIVDLQKKGSSQEADISSETESSQKKTKFLAKKRRHESTLTTFEDKSKKIGFEKTYLSVPKEKSRPVVSRGKTKHQLDIPQEASKLRKRSYETLSESTDIDIGDLQEAGSSLKSDISPKAYGSPRKRKCLEIRRRYDSSSSIDEDKDEKKGI